LRFLGVAQKTQATSGFTTDTTEQQILKGMKN
jgi:hypothetical protein